MARPTKDDDDLLTSLMQTHVTGKVKAMVSRRISENGESEAVYLRRLVMTDLRLPKK